MRRLLTLPTPLAALPLFAAVVWGTHHEPATISEPKPVVEPLPGRAFATSVLDDIHAGARLSAIELTERDDSMQLALVYARNRAAHRFILDFAQDGTPRAFQRETLAAPKELRVYRVEREIADALADGEVTGLEIGCDEYLMVTPLHGVPVEPDDYYVVQERLNGANAGERAASAMLAANKQGFLLIDVDSDGRRSANLIWGDGVTKLAVHLRMNRQGQVSSVELRESPGGEPVQLYRKEEERMLLSVLARAGAIVGARWQLRGQELDEGQVPLELSLRDHTVVVVDPANFQAQY